MSIVAFGLVVVGEQEAENFRAWIRGAGSGTAGPDSTRFHVRETVGASSYIGPIYICHQASAASPLVCIQIQSRSSCICPSLHLIAALTVKSSTD